MKPPSWTINLPRDVGEPSPDWVYTITKDGKVVVAEAPLDLSAGPVTLSASRPDAGALVLRVLLTTKSDRDSLSRRRCRRAAKRLRSILGFLCCFVFHPGRQGWRQCTDDR